MKTLIFFEFKRFLRKKKSIISILTFTVIILLYVLINNNQENKKYNEELPRCEFEINSVQEGLNSVTVKYNQNANSDDQIMLSNLDKIKVSYEKQLKLLNEKRLSIINKDWKNKLSAEIQLDKDLLENIQQGNVVTGETTDIINNRINQNELLLNKNIEPIYLDCSMKSFNFLRLVGINLVPLILVILIIVLCADFVSNDIEEGTYKLLLIQPITRNKIMYSKIIASSIICIATVFTIFFLFFVGLTLTEGTGAHNYPIAYYSGISTTFVDISKFDLYMIPLYIILIITIVAIAIMLSTIIGNNSSAISSAIVIYVALYIFSTQLHLLGKFAQFIPSTYSNIPILLDGTAGRTYNNNNITYLSGIIVLSIYTIICYIISLKTFKRKDIL